MYRDLIRQFIGMAVLFMAMAFLESAVVVYLRALYYPGGFAFPLVPMDAALVRTEAWREAATLVMLLTPSILLSRFALDRFAWFCFAFGVWDLFYYFWLKVLLNWPADLTEPDLLFLLPVPWVGPVWAPCVVSIGLIALAVLLLRVRIGHRGRAMGIGNWALFIGAALFIIASFTWGAMVHGIGVDDLSVGLGNDAMEASATALLLNEAFYWPLFALGSLAGLLGLLRLARRQHLGS
jgi:hypothetical protein